MANVFPSPIIRINPFSHKSKTTSSDCKNLRDFYSKFGISITRFWHGTSKCAWKQGDGNIATVYWLSPVILPMFELIQSKARHSCKSVWRLMGLIAVVIPMDLPNMRLFQWWVESWGVGPCWHSQHSNRWHCYLRNNSSFWLWVLLWVESVTEDDYDRCLRSPSLWSLMISRVT